MTQPRKILLHIGLPKTGTTAFQLACATHAPALKAQGACWYRNYLNPGHNCAEELVLSAMRPDLECFASSNHRGIDLAEVRERTRAEIAATLRQPGIDRFIFSDEDLCFLRHEDELARLRGLFPDDVEFEVFLVVREPVDWARSYTTQITKPGRGVSDDPRSAFHLAPGSWVYDFEAMERTFRAAFGTVRVVNYDRDSAVPDLLAAMGLELPPEAVAIRANVRNWRQRLRARFPRLGQRYVDLRAAVRSLGLWPQRGG